MAGVPQSAQEKTEEAMKKDKADGTKDKASNVAEDKTDTVKDKASETAQKTREQMKSMVQDTADAMKLTFGTALQEEQPSADAAHNN